jgi:MtN3 and saliva related transmembrane protein
VEIATVIGSLAAVASTLSFTPQAWKIIKSRQTHDLSAKMYTLTVTGFALWTVYGVLLGEWPLILTNSLCLLLAGFILTMKLLPRRKKEAVADLLDPAAAGGSLEAVQPKRPLQADDGAFDRLQQRNRQ